VLFARWHHSSRVAISQCDITKYYDIWNCFLLPITLIKVYLITLYINKLTTTIYVNTNNYSVLNLCIEVLPIGRMLKRGQDYLFASRNSDHIASSPDWLQLAWTSSEIFRILQFAPTGRKFNQKLLEIEPETYDPKASQP